MKSGLSKAADGVDTQLEATSQSAALERFGHVWSKSWDPKMASSAWKMTINERRSNGIFGGSHVSATEYSGHPCGFNILLGRSRNRQPVLSVFIFVTRSRTNDLIHRTATSIWQVSSII